MRRIILPILTSCLLSLAACSDAPDRAAYLDEDPAWNDAPLAAAPARPAVDEALGQPGLSLTALTDRVQARNGQGQLVVLEQLNEPAHIETHTVRNPKDPNQTDTIQIYHYAGLQLDVYEVAATGQHFIQRIHVTSGDYRTEKGLSIGSTRSDVVDALGIADRNEGNIMLYELDPERPLVSYLSFRLVDESVRGMTWHYPVD